MNGDFYFCSGCGFKMDKNYGFCPVCGTRISGENQGPVLNTPPSNQMVHNFGVNNNSLYNQPGVNPGYQTQYFPPPKKNNTALVVVLIVIGLLILGAIVYFGLKLLNGNSGTSTGPADGSKIINDQDVSGIWEGTVVFNNAKNLNNSSNSDQIIKVLNKPLKTKMEIVPHSKNNGEITIYIAEEVEEDPGSDGLTLDYQLNNGELKAQVEENGNLVAADFKLGSKNGVLQLKGTLTISGRQSDDSTATIKGNVDIAWLSKIVLEPDSSNNNVPESNTADQGSKRPDSSSGSGSEGDSGNSQGSSNNQQSQTAQYIEDPMLYLPAANMKYTFQSWYQDGESEKINVVSGVIPGFSIVTTVDLYEQSEPFTQHFVDGPDGVYVFSDEEYNNNTAIWLPYNGSVGDSWDVDGVPVKIVRLGAPCDLGYMKLDNCIVMEIDYSDAGVVYISYIAPNYGTVLVTDKESGSLRMKLLDAVPISEQEAESIVKQYSPNAMDKIGN